MKFIDSIEIFIRSGKGGRGLVSFKSARGAPKLGADGGDGGFGGDVIFRTKPGMSTLSHLYHKRTYAAEDGHRGGNQGKTGRNGEAVVIEVPPGTVVIDAESGQQVLEMIEPNQQHVIAKGGKRGLGNRRFLSSRRQAPEQSTSGGPPIELALRLELKLLADIGLAGFPNAGKSTLLRAISDAKPKVGAYPFTTLQPQLGVVSLEAETGESWGPSFVVADIPGLIEGASHGKGLGFQFLRHLERAKALVFLIDVSRPDPLADFTSLQSELKQFSSELSEKPKLVVLSKIDLVDTETVDQLRQKFESTGAKVEDISAVDGSGMRALKYAMLELSESMASSDPVQGGQQDLGLLRVNEVTMQDEI